MPQTLSDHSIGLRGAIHLGLAVGAVLIFYTYLDSYIFAMGGPKPWHWVIGFAAAAGVLVVIAPKRPSALLRSPLILWLLFYFSITSIWAPFMSSSEDAWQVVYDRCRSVACIVALAVIFDDDRARRWAILLVAACVAVASALNLAELVSLVRFDVGPERIIGRSSGLRFDPNQSALAIAMGLAVVAEQVPRLWRMPLLLLGTLGVAATFSRSGMVCLALVILWLVWRRALGAWTIVLGTVSGVLLLSSTIDFLGANDLLTDNTTSRLRLSRGDSGRIELALKAWHMFLVSPWVGQGLGATRIWDENQFAHNMFATLAAEQGILGLLAFPALGAALLRAQSAAACFALTLMVAGLFAHDLLSERGILLLVALAAANPAPTTAPAQGPGLLSRAPVPEM
jgi:hypothetical protein